MIERLIERFFVRRTQTDIDDLFDTAGADLHRHAEVLTVNAIFAFEQRRAWQDFLLIEKKRLGHLDRRRRR